MTLFQDIHIMSVGIEQVIFIVPIMDNKKTTYQQKNAK